MSPGNIYIILQNMACLEFLFVNLYKQNLREILSWVFSVLDVPITDTSRRLYCILQRDSWHFLKCMNYHLSYSCFFKYMYRSSLVPMDKRFYLTMHRTKLKSKAQREITLSRDPGRTLLPSLVPMLEKKKKKTMRKDTFSELGSVQRCHRLG